MITVKKKFKSELRTTKNSKFAGEKNQTQKFRHFFLKVGTRNKLFGYILTKLKIYFNYTRKND